jgi:hypothetical protein
MTLTISDAAVYVSTLLQNQRLNVNNQQPGLAMANIVLQRMLGSPFVWRFNRGSIDVPISTAGTTDYVVSIPDLGRIETQWLTDATGNISELNGAVELAKVTSVRRPVLAAPVYDDNQGNITLRFNSVPDQNYTAAFDYQRKAPLLTSWAQPFGPVPDEFGYIFNKWFLAEAAILVNNSLFEIWRREAVSALLATQDGLDAQAKLIFLEQMTNVGRTASRSQAAGQSGAQGRAS